MNYIERENTMKALTFEQIKDITFGAIRIEQQEEGIRFFRGTPKQVKVWSSKRSDLGNRAECTAGIRLDFHTDSQNLSMTVNRDGKYDVYINGLLRSQYKMKVGENFSLSLDDPLGHPLDYKRVTIYFPCHSRAFVTSVELDDCAKITPHTYDCKMLFIGDSITQGWEASFESLSYPWQVARFFNADIVNQAIGGTYFCEDAFDLIPFDPDVIIVAYGTNDFVYYKTYDEMREQAKAHLTLISKQYSDKKIFVLSPIWREQRENHAMGTFEGCRQIVAEQAEMLGLIHIDGLLLVPPLPVFFKDEYLHPNDLGMSLYAENLIIELKKYL